MRMRTLRPEACTSETLAEVPRAARWTFACLWMYCDDAGRAVAHLKLIKAALYPLDDDITLDDIQADLKELEHHGAICFYEANGKSYLHVPAWSVHQHPNRPTPSRLPPCPVHEVSGGTDGGLTASSVSTSDVINEHSIGAPTSTSTSTSTSTKRVIDEAFNQFWAIYPRRVSKQGARSKFEIALRKVDPDTLLDGAKRYRDDPNRVAEFTKHPSTWLHNGCWDDEPLPPRGQQQATRTSAPHDWMNPGGAR